jgi:hypothetical protein
MNAGVVLGASTQARRPSLPVTEGLAQLLPERGLVRGHTVTCVGGAAVSMALALVAAATQAGSWLALVDVPWVAPEAADEMGVALERLVSIRVDSGNTAQWAERVAAAADGCELIITRMPPRLPDRLLRQVRQRIQAAGGVLIDVGDPAGAVLGATNPGQRSMSELVVSTGSEIWEGLDRGSGYLRCRRLSVVVAGRRVPRARRAAGWLPGPSGGFELIDSIDVGRSATSELGRPG